MRLCRGGCRRCASCQLASESAARLEEFFVMSFSAHSSVRSTSPWAHRHRAAAAALASGWCLQGLDTVSASWALCGSAGLVSPALAAVTQWRGALGWSVDSCDSLWLGCSRHLACFCACWSRIAESRPVIHRATCMQRKSRKHRILLLTSGRMEPVGMKLTIASGERQAVRCPFFEDL